MTKYRKKPVVVEAITFDELVAHGRTQTGDTNGMPWSFDYAGHLITHENDDCYLIPTDEGSMAFKRGDMLIIGTEGEVYPCKPDAFAATYDVAGVVGASWKDEAGLLLNTILNRRIGGKGELADDIALVARALEMAHATGLKRGLREPGESTPGKATG